MQQLSNTEISQLEREVSKQFEDIPLVVTDPLAWRIVQSRRFRKGGNIMHLEGLALVWAVRRACRSPSLHHSRLLFLVDNMSLCCALTKGRSSSPHLLPTCRTLAAYALACGLKIATRWIASEHNPADLPSRVFASSLRHAALRDLEEARRRSHTEVAADTLPPVLPQAGPGEEAAPSPLVPRVERAPLAQPEEEAGVQRGQDPRHAATRRAALVARGSAQGFRRPPRPQGAQVAEASAAVSSCATDEEHVEKDPAEAEEEAQA